MAERSVDGYKGPDTIDLTQSNGISIELDRTTWNSIHELVEFD